MKKNKVDIKKLIDEIKGSRRREDLGKKLTESLVHPQFRVRDMRDEAKDMGSHEADKYFGGDAA